MELNGWSSPQMLRCYGASARSARAHRTYDRIMTGRPGPCLAIAARPRGYARLRLRSGPTQTNVRIYDERILINSRRRKAGRHLLAPLLSSFIN